MAHHSFEDLEVWQAASRLAVEVYAVLKGCQDHALRDQMTRAAVSIPSNIAEGAERETSAEFARFIYIARGSAAELRTQLYIADRIGLISDDDRCRLTRELKKISGQLHRLAQAVRNQGTVGELPAEYLKPET